jgi:hypothetical protein
MKTVAVLFQNMSHHWAGQIAVRNKWSMSNGSGLSGRDPNPRSPKYEAVMPSSQLRSYTHIKQRPSNVPLLVPVNVLMPYRILECKDMKANIVSVKFLDLSVMFLPVLLWISIPYPISNTVENTTHGTQFREATQSSCKEGETCLSFELENSRKYYLYKSVVVGSI